MISPYKFCHYHYHPFVLSFPVTKSLGDLIWCGADFAIVALSAVVAMGYYGEVGGYDG